MKIYIYIYVYFFIITHYFYFTKGLTPLHNNVRNLRHKTNKVFKLIPRGKIEKK